MKAKHALLLATLVGSARSFAVEGAIPEAYPADRYAAMVAQSPFALATPVAPPPTAPERGFAADWYVTGLARYDDKDFVSVKSRDLATSFSLYGNEESNGVTLVGVEWSSERGKSTVTVRKGGEIARLEFNQAELQSAAPPQQMPAPGAAGQPRSVVPQQPGQARINPPGQQAPRPVVTQLPQPVPVTNPVMQPPRAAIPRPTGAPVINQPVTMPGAVNANVMPGGVSPTGAPSDSGSSDNRRRIRVINPK